MGDTPDSTLAALGAFLLSPGFGGLAALLAASVAWHGVRLRLDGDRELARKSREAARQADPVAEGARALIDRLRENRESLPHGV